MTFMTATDVPIPPGQARSHTITPVILSGGTGTRLWPVSRASHPKQFWALASRRTMIGETLQRAAGEAFAPPIVVCNQDHRFLVAEQLRENGCEDGRIVLEPAGRNTAAAIAAAALLAAQDDPGTLLWIMAADASFQHPERLAEVLEKGAQVAREGYIVTFGMKPTAPETGYGYIRAGAPLHPDGGRDDAHRVARFVEKPDRLRATEMLNEGGYLWNSGMFMAPASVMLEELERHEPAVLDAVRTAMAHSQSDLTFLRLERDSFMRSPSVSIDYAVMERTERAVVIPADLGWADVGNWNSLWELGDKDACGNVVTGDVVLEQSHNCYVRSEGMLAAVAGLTDVVLVVTSDAVLAIHRDYAQDVSALVAQLKATSRPEAEIHNRCYRPWGFYEGLIQGERFQVKRIVVYPGQKLSLQKHFHRAEHWVVVSGTASVTRDDENLLLQENESVYLPLGCMHRLENPGRIPLTLIEVQSGPYLGEDDIVRFEDTYGRQ
ncbi:mannose-1-phosphate guanylyltransferase/mannose-6-phosphate isomerase [Komagataeibacter sp. FNDCF1]|uniref:mannose-1-phosphate guanylyltransferase/mannose-6-phosphate isomerase n=1 Tax=Komagataeibacter sp. FNDCF1 TaxID=2878681 RepID=UPI001E5F3C71|nr:mannose-1-phosphate guanylyltransferase/mannose-6-phosphate isomerase [Komagataeibacter sp. FNDCF1]MCE2566126.1 mannose-1-phosphate guanylyltransferase/mannose-6-phosphate isomerase [Komagataeibacter sp. FNDCF1]